MPTDSGERRPAKAQGVGMGGAHPPEPEQHLPCPRCDSTNTKFCYYNNYNLSQPRHFCKSCRRYWTQGGTLRNVPVGGATRKNAKRSRTATSSSNPSTSSATAATNPSSSTSSPAAALKLEIPAPPPGDAGLTGMTSSGSFTSLLSSQGCSPGFLALGGFGLGLGSGYEEMGFGLGRGAVWPYQEVGAVDGGHGVVGAGGCGGSAAVAPLSSGCSGWQLGGGGGGGGEGGFGDGAECGFAWPDLAISMSGKGFK